MSHRKSRRPVMACAAVLAVVVVTAIALAGMADAQGESSFKREPGVDALGICPPFFLRDENNEIINPITGANAGKPYSPRKTCGACHDYEAITQAYHFQQGRGEKPDPVMSRRAQWAITPGNYGGAYCAPAPLYSYLSPKNNSGARTMDMTSFTFVQKCGMCHPGGGPAEFDRDGQRYDVRMADPQSGFTPGADNRFDGDYFKAAWTKSGVVEADCLICHLASYSFPVRNGNLKKLNYRWAATSGAGLAEVTGYVADGKTPSVKYDKKKFLPDGRIELPIIRRPRNAACLSCHAQPGYKKRGASFSARTDVHIRAGLKCVDCHTSGTSSADPRNGRKNDHNFGKGDDPGILARNDLDNTVVTCRQCHASGKLGAPIPAHRGLSPVHLEKIACQTCHIPGRTVRASQFMASDVFNPGARIKPETKKLWTFYGPDMKLYNHYGYLNMMGYDDMPYYPFNPVYVRYKGKIYPVNRTHSAWPAIETQGAQGLMQPKMSDVYRMWEDFKKDPASYPELAKIRDDNGDRVIEVNTPDEIDAIIASITRMLERTNYPMEGKKVLWVMNDRAYSSGTSYATLPKEEWEASPYANVHKYSHDVFPARSALGSKGCVQCHSASAPLFFQNVPLYPLGPDAQPVYAKNHRILGYSQFALALMSFLQGYIKPLSVWVILAFIMLLLLHYIVIGPRETARVAVDGETLTRFSRKERVVHYGAVIAFFFLAVTGFSVFWGGGFASDTIRSLYAVHFVAGLALIAVGLLKVLMWRQDVSFEHFDRDWFKKLGGYFGHRGGLESGRFNAGQKVFFIFMVASVCVLGTSGLLLLALDGGGVRMVLHFIHDLCAILFVIAVLAHMYLGVLLNPTSLKAIVRGVVPREWAREHHPRWLDY